jgi:DNA processing protein
VQCINQDLSIPVNATMCYTITHTYYCQCFSAMNFPNINTSSPDDSLYLSPLSVLALKPKRLYYRGTLPPGRVTSVALVGTRKPTAYGREVTEMLARELSQAGLIIVSGLALGIDAIAHKAAVDARGTTIAVLASGVLDITPRTNSALGERILASRGAIISEYEPHEPAYPGRFLERNRLISGLADAVIVTEAALHSGTMNTVAHALEQGREVFAVPGPLTSPMSAGCNAMIRQGAHIVTSANDILDVLLPHYASTDHNFSRGDTPAEDAIIDAVRRGLRDGDEIQKECRLPAAEFNEALTMLEIRGIVKSLGANRWTLA